MEIEFKGQKRELREVSYLDAVEVSELREKDGLRAAIKKMLNALGFTDEEAESLTLKEGLSLQLAIDEVTKGFQLPVEKKE